MCTCPGNLMLSEVCFSERAPAQDLTVLPRPLAGCCLFDFARSGRARLSKDPTE